MLELRIDRSFTSEDINSLYMSKGYSSYEGRLDALYDAAVSSDHIVTAWDGAKMVGVIRSSGDMEFTQYIADLIVHPEYKSMGLASNLMSAYIDEVSAVEEIYLMIDSTSKNSFTKNWLVYKGFESLAETDKKIIYIMRKDINEG
ncbi:MAG TPA: GNAT family N-acetyltransferase [Candidatus Salinicoccus stercoripullorum]|uniref:GNAT family N-acetyltransferase n=1 Tax=Candidatus Salinicoccus stercoripullorum TaxID=2838756 RepID=A0A9D1QH87_9STAP|nr:GNAT family N-acetyltransferase [Candidatus Salinicoccus stercoripullorum]